MRRRSDSGSFLAIIFCILASIAINIGAFIASIHILLNRPSSFYPLTTSSPGCALVYQRFFAVLTGAASGDASVLGTRLFQLWHSKCPSEPFVVAFVPEEIPELNVPEPLDQESQVEALKQKKPKELPKPIPEEPEKQPLPKPKEPPPPEPEPQPEQTPQEPLKLEQLKMVEQLDQDDEKQAPENANYLSNINRDVQEETRARITNMIKDADKTTAKQQEPSKIQEQGTADHDKIAELDQQPQAKGQKIPPTATSPKPEKYVKEPPKPPSLLTMRNQVPTPHPEAMKQHTAMVDAANDGQMAADRPEQNAGTPTPPQDATQAHRQQQKYNLHLSHAELNEKYGEQVDASNQVLKQRMTQKKGIWADANEHWQSPLENMVPEVRVGNQTALRSRKHPFARYIATMHRAIHDRWAWGYLDNLDRLSPTHPLNKPDVWTRLEIVLNSDGTIDKVRTIHFSGHMEFDAAAREVIYAAGPFPNPPAEIQSGNGKIYLHWAFHRDERACGTFLAQPFILDNAGQGDRPDPNQEIYATRASEQAHEHRRLSRGNPKATQVEGPTVPTPGHSHHGTGVAIPQKNSSPLQESSALMESSAGANVESPPSDSREEKDPNAQKVAHAWLGYLQQGKIDLLVSRSGVPFYTGERIVAQHQDDLRELLKAMIAESAQTSPSPVQLFTAAELGKRFGSVPAGVQEGQGRIYGWTKIGDESLILFLEKRFGVWRVVGIAR